MTTAARGLAACGVLATVLVTACSRAEQGGFEVPRVVEPSYTETGDFPAIHAHGRLRLLMVRRPGTVDRLPRAGSPADAQLRAASHFARSLGLEPVIVLVDHFEQLVPALSEGRGDVIVANLAITEERRDRIGFTVALDRSRQVLVASSDDTLDRREDLAGRTVTVGPNSRFRDTARALQEQHPQLNVESQPGLSARRKLDKLARGEIDLTILDGNTVEAVLEYREDVRSVFPVSEETGVGWGVRKDARQLNHMLDRFITQRKLAQIEREHRTGDLPVIKRSRELRVALRNDAASYFVWRGQLLGFQYELAQRFAASLDLRLEVVVPDDDETLRGLVREGRADIAASFLTADGGEPGDGIAYSRPCHFAVKQVVTDADDIGPQRLADLDGRTFRVRRDSGAWRALERLREREDIDFAIEAVPEDQQPETTIARVASGDYDLTLVDDHLAKNAAAWREDVRAVLEIGDPVAHRWAVRADDDQLRAAVDRYLERTYRGTFYNVVYAKYFQDHEHIRQFRAQRVDLSSGRELSPYDGVVKKYASRYGLDWRLIVAQIYQESAFNPHARSWAGAHGVMQIMPRTARQVGLDGDLADPEVNIRAGIRYLDWLRARFEEDLHVRDRTWFTLAAFNAGTGHVRDARRLARELGLDPDRWFDNVERAMVKLAQPAHYRDARFGYVRGREPVGYVRKIRERYQAYILWTDDCWPTCDDSPHPTTVARYTRRERPGPAGRFQP